MADINPKQSWYSQDALWFDCPACGEYHRIPFQSKTGANWTFDGNREKPTFSPSVRVRHGQGLKQTCHFFVRNGMIEFCGDCTHDMRGKTVPLPPFEVEGGRNG